LDFIPINRPLLGEEEQKAVIEVIQSGKLTDSSLEGGEVVQRLEGKLRRKLRVKHVVSTNSGTAALHCSLLALGVGRGDEVILPSFTFVSTANVVLACGARPVFVDNGPDYNMEPKSFAKALSRKTKAVIPVHLYGYPAEMEEINETAERHSVSVIEDAAESLGAEYKGKQTGTLSRMGCFSLYATKVVTSGEGGAVSTDDDELADKLKLIRNHGMLHGYDSRHLGFNYRMTEIAAAIGSAQMGKLNRFIRARTRNARFLNDRVSGLEGVEFTQTASDRTHVFYLYTLRLRKRRDEVLKFLNRKGVGASVYFRMPVHKTPLYLRQGYGRLKLMGAKDASKHVLSLPVHPAMTRQDLERVADEFVKASAFLR